MNRSARRLRLARLIALLFTVALFSSFTHAACHTVLPTGSGSNSGADWNNAMAGLPASMIRGDIYYVAAGSYGGKTFNDADNGTSTIEVRSTTAADHCTDVGWNSSTLLGQAVFSCSSGCQAVLYFATDYYIFNGQNCTLLPDANVCTGGYGFLVNNTNGQASASVQGGLGYNGPPDFDHDITVKFTELNGAHPTSDSSPLDIGVDFEGGSYNLMFDHLYVHDDWVPFYIKGNHNHQNGSGYVFGSGDNVTIQNSYLAHNYSSSANHSEGCSCSEGITNFTIRYNYIVDMVGTAYIATPSGADYNTGNGSNGPWMIYGNVFMATPTGISSLHCGTGDGMFAAFGTTFGGDIYFLNNTIARFNGCQADNNSLGIGLGFTTPLQHLYVQNNLFWNTDVITVINTGVTSWDSASFAGVNWSFNSYDQIPDSSAAADNDSNKQVLTTDPFANSASSDWTLATNTAAGSSTHPILPGNDVDMNGVARGANGTWDRGAIQLAGATQTAPSPPTGLTAVAH
jgi:hypothetical protein